ncbi:sigma-54 interaction domain-containing protein [Bacillus sp. JJ1562]|uniref:sigma-54 interaction domain-containing protein n=1 Tax=Bacillus sp. JJ1562 TaxID=3122960 RepID=UPI003003A258
MLNKINKEFTSEVQILKEKLDQLEIKHKDLQNILEHSYDGVALTNSEGVTVQVNKAWDRLTGLKREDVLGVPMEILVKRGYFSDSVTMKVIESNRPVTIMQKMKSGKQAIMTGSPVFDNSGKLYQVIINIRDVTELYQLKENLENKEKLAERYHTEISQIKLYQNNPDDIVAQSKTMRDLLDLASRVARVDSTVMITGESGVGKGVVARFIHKSSKRGIAQPFITVNCGAIPHELLESELFGYVGGAFTGANKSGKPGMFELANGGTLFLDEIADLPLKLQVKLLHVLQEKEMTRVGGTTPIKLDLRVISATNKDLLNLIGEGKFREDLYYRLNVVPLTIPPLRLRKEDILPLAAHFLNVYNHKYSMNKSISAELLDTMIDYDWPGNIRELSNIIERMMVTTNSDVLYHYIFPIHSKEVFNPHLDHVTEDEVMTLKEAYDHLEANLITRALEIGKTQVKAAEILGVSLSTFLRKAKRLNVL